MAAVGQTIVGGHTFAGATGAKTGQNLEDLSEKSTLVSGSPFLDGVTLTTKELAGTTDKDGNNIFQAEIKDGGVATAKIADLGVSTAKIAAEAVTAAKILNGMYGGIALIAQDNTDFTFKGQTAIDNADLDTITTADNTTLQETAKAMVSASSIYTDLGAVYRGWFMIKLRWTNVTSVTNIRVNPWVGYNAPTWSSNQPTNIVWLLGALGTANGLNLTPPVINEDHIVSTPFHGRYIGISWQYTGGAPEFKFSRWAVAGEAADPGI